MMNSLCTMNSDGEYCMDYYYGMEDAAMDDGDDWSMCDYFTGMNDDSNNEACSSIDDIGCCAGTISIFSPTCVNEFMSGCGSDLSTICTAGTMQPTSVVSGSFELDSYMDLDDQTTSDTLRSNIAISASSSSVTVSMDDVSITSWSGSSSRRVSIVHSVSNFFRGVVGEKKRGLAAMTSVEYAITFVGDDGAAYATDVETTITDGDFATDLATETGSTVTGGDTAVVSDYEADPLDLSDDFGYSAIPSFNMLLMVVMAFAYITLS